MRFQFYAVFIFILYSYEVLSKPPVKVLPLIPIPAELIQGKGVFKLSEDTKLFVADSNFNNEAAYLQSYLKTNYDISIEIVSKLPSKGNYIELKKGSIVPFVTESVKHKSKEQEFYELNISKKSIVIEAYLKYLELKWD